jgi:site-specific DNA-methyltransferase (adenine-specific)
MIELNKIYNEDCLQGMSRIDSDTIDLIFADPPFHLNKKFDNKNWSLEEYYEWCEKWITESFRILKSNGSFFIMTAQEHVGRMGYYLDKLGYFRNLIIWYNSSMPVKNRFCRGYQPIYWYSRDNKNYTFNYGIEKRNSKAVLPYGKENKAGSIKDIWDDIPFISGGCMASKEAILETGSKKKAHPAQMPVRLIERIVTYCSNENDIVLDPFIGSGTTAIACLNTNRNYIGFESDTKYWYISQERIAKHTI